MRAFYYLMLSAALVAGCERNDADDDLGDPVVVTDASQPGTQGQAVASNQPGSTPGQAPMQPVPNQPVPGQPVPGQPGQPVPGQPGQPVPGQPVPGQPVPGQPGQPGQPVPGQPVPGQPVPGQPVPGQPVPGQPVASCPDNHSIDPPASELLEANTLAASGQNQAAYAQYAALIGRYPHSATLRVRAGSLMLGPPERGGNPVQAQTMFQQAVQLHDAGCRMIERDEWEALEGLALALMYQRNYAAAIPHLQRSVSQWGTVAQTQYNLACAFCQTGNIDACHQYFVGALNIAATGQRPVFITNPPSAGSYVELSQRDPDLAPLRNDPRYEQAIAPYRPRRRSRRGRR